MAEFYGVALPEGSICILGGVGTGKTEQLVQAAASYVAAGEKTLVLTASPTAADAFSRRLSLVCSGAASDVTVCTPQDVALQILATDEALARTGKKARILTNFETNVLMEDMKTSGLRSKRLKEMLKFFYRNKSEMVDDDPFWACSDEEVQIDNLLQKCLKNMRAYLPCEVSNVAVNQLREDEELRAKFCAPHVLVDDFQALSKASQILAVMLAGQTLVVAGDTYAGGEVFEQYPYLDGLFKMASQRGVDVCQLTSSHCCGAAVKGLNTLRRDIDATLSTIELARLDEAIYARMDLTGRIYDECKLAVLAENPGFGAPAPNPQNQEMSACASSDLGSVELCECKTPAEEAETVGKRIASAVQAGVKVENIVLVVPNRVWARSMGKALSKQGIQSVETFEPQAFNGDVRDLARCEAARVFTLIRLAADPTDAAALRTWCSFGDWLANSTAFLALRSACEIADVTLPWALETLSGDASIEGCGIFGGIELGADEIQALGRVKDAYMAAKAAVAKLSGLVGEELLAAATREALGAGAATPKAFAQVVECVPDFASCDAQALCDRLDVVMRAPVLPHVAGKVSVGTIDQLNGISCELLVISGFVNGFIPRSSYFDSTQTNLDRMPHIHVGDVRRVYAALGKSSRDVTVTSFSQLDAIQAEKLNLKIDRIRMQAGARIAKVSTSELADYIKA